MNFAYDISVIVPVYNVEDYLEGCLQSLLAQTIDHKRMEVILVNDGSTDASGKICDDYAAKYEIFKVFHLENGGVSNARNFGMDKAQGRYMMFLDSDDTLTGKSVANLVKFFQKHDSQVDLVTYQESNVRDGETTPSKHFRYRYIEKTGVYDLNDPDYMYFAQTHMNIVIKNRGQDNLKFDTTMIFHEDQKFILTQLADKHKIGFCAGATYNYLINAAGATSQRSHPYYIFEKTIALWESFFAQAEIPKYVQVFFLHDFIWKLRADMLWPYHYKGADFDNAVNRVVTLIRRVDDDVIRNFPGLAAPHKAYIWQLKYGDQVQIQLHENDYQFTIRDEKLLEAKNIEVYVSQFRVKNNQLTMVGTLKCIAANFTEDVSLEAALVTKEGKKPLPLTLKESSLSLFASKTKTNNFKTFILRLPLTDVKALTFTAGIMSKNYPIRFTFAPTAPFNRGIHRLSYLCEGLCIKLKETGFRFAKSNIFQGAKNFLRNALWARKIGVRNFLTKVIAPSYKKKNRIWLYCDSSKTVKDNAYYQFLHDVKKQDGIRRYYVYNPQADISGWFDESHTPHLLPYGSVKHRLYALCADKILTSFYGLRDIISYPYGAYRYFADLTNFQLIYLQHGVLHANLPTMYSLDRMNIDKEVISTTFEEKSLQEHYGFDPSFLIPCGMPRYNHIDKTKQAEKKILFAPSWRKFLVKSDGMGSWLPNEKAFLNSDFYRNINAFLQSPKLREALKKHGFVLDFKPHPNFRMYDHLFNVDGETVRIAPAKVDEFSYSIFITDFSSFLYDFVYLKRPILYFVPDMELFEAGMNHYRKLDIPFEEGFGAFSADGEQAVEDVVALMENGCVPDEKYVQRMNGLFYDIDDHEEALYQAILKQD